MFYKQTEAHVITYAMERARESARELRLRLAYWITMRRFWARIQILVLRFSLFAGASTAHCKKIMYVARGLSPEAC